MARGKKTGGRNFGPGNPGRPPGVKEAVSRSLKASIKAVLADVVGSEPTLLREAIRRGLAATPPKSFPYLQLAAHYLDGKPPEQLNLRGLASLSDNELQQLDRLLAKGMGEGTEP